MMAEYWRVSSVVKCSSDTPEDRKLVQAMTRARILYECSLKIATGVNVYQSFGQNIGHMMKIPARYINYVQMKLLLNVLPCF